MSIVIVTLFLSILISSVAPIYAVLYQDEQAETTSLDGSEADIYLENIKELFKTSEETFVNHTKLQKLIIDALELKTIILIGATAQDIPRSLTVAVLHKKIVDAKLTEEELEQLTLMIARLKELYKQFAKRSSEGEYRSLYCAAKLKALDSLLKILLALVIEPSDDENLFDYGAKPEINTLPDYLQEEYKELFSNASELLQCAVQVNRAHLVARALKRFASLDYTSEEYDKKTVLEVVDDKQIQSARMLFAYATRRNNLAKDALEKALTQAAIKRSFPMLELIAEYYDVFESQVLYRISSPIFPPLKLRNNVDLLVNFIKLGIGLANYPLHHRDKGLFDQELTTFCENKWSTEERQKWYNLFKVLFLYGAGGSHRYTTYWEKMHNLMLEFDDDVRLVALTGTVNDVKNSLEKNKLTHIREADKPLPYEGALPCHTLLYLAVLRAKLEVVQYLVAAGLEVNEASPYNNQYSLHAALGRYPFTETEKDHTKEIIELLLEHGAQPNLKPTSKKTNSIKSKALEQSNTTKLASGICSL